MMASRWAGVVQEMHSKRTGTPWLRWVTPRAIFPQASHCTLQRALYEWASVFVMVLVYTTTGWVYTGSPVKRLGWVVYIVTMESESVFEIAYVTPTGKHGRRQVYRSHVPSVCEQLERRGFRDIRVSTYPLIEGVDPIFVA